MEYKLIDFDVLEGGAYVVGVSIWDSGFGEYEKRYFDCYFDDRLIKVSVICEDSNIINFLDSKVVDIIRQVIKNHINGH